MAVSDSLAVLDFAQIKQNIISTYQNNPAFTDYNFQGSTIGTLIDILAYVTHYQGVYANMAFSERFLDSATLRDSVVSLAKEIGYFPSQVTSAQAIVNISTSAANVIGSPASIWILNNINFLGQTTDGTTHEFHSTGANEIYRSTDGLTYSGDITIVQGTPVHQRFVYDPMTRPEYILPNTNIAVDSIKVRVKPNTQVSDNINSNWIYSKNAIFNSPTDPVFFLEEAKANQIRLFFGDGTVSKQINGGNELLVDFDVSSGAAANGSAGFQLQSTIDGITANNFSVLLVSSAVGGADRESKASISTNAAASYSAQNRAVTIEDYKTLLINRFPYIDSISVWGGESNTPPQFGQVFISIKPNYANFLDTSGHNAILSYLKSVAIVGTGINIIWPSLLYVNTITTATFSRALTPDSTIAIESAVNAAIINYFSPTNAAQLNLDVKYSKLLESIDLSHNSILSNITDISITSKFIPDTIHAQNFEVNFANAIKPNTVISDIWTNQAGDQYQMKDNGNGNVTLTKNGTPFIQNAAPHTVDYTTGIVKFTAFLADIVPAQSISLNATPQSNDVVSDRSTILQAGTQTTVIVRKV